MTTSAASEPGPPAPVAAPPATRPSALPVQPVPATPPTTPCSVVWCEGRPYVLEGRHGRARWVGTDYRGRPEALSSAEVQRRGWTHSRRRAG
ncbi:hypothetical protein [Amycolatopsis sp. PS_44_ISF1]|uniref:hypothetical protein n=1 Tax=Amycolatopsis sp. PS_44_ISF1 TaxID=2974917 RepID=UPI0028DDFFC0|nr:hypothetical protein [Amycolatopsis sp. PS_44_ISF1]MDT8912620.1 hypothetical protein [Amycolatopsis sp. PS_44_ISF1]